MNVDLDSVFFKNFPTICRLCLSSDDLVYLFSDPKVISTVKSLTNLKLKEDDKLPKNICINCCTKLEDISSFIETCINNDAILKAITFQEEDEKMAKTLEHCKLGVTENKLEPVEEIQVKVESADADRNEENIFTVQIVNEETVLDNEENEIKGACNIEDNDVVAKKNKKVFICKHCDKRFDKLAHLQFHIFSHENAKSLNCSQCDKIFLNKTALTRHLHLHSGGEPSRGKKEIKSKKRNDMCLCVYCSKYFTRISDLRKHLRTHTGVKLFSCLVCDRKFSQKSALTRHSFLHTEKFKCSICYRPFTRESQLNNHITKGYCYKNSKLRSDSLICNICDKSYSSKYYLGAHMRMHRGTKDFKCDICNKAFLLKIALNRHYSSHTGIREFKCDKCEAAFISNALLNRHKICHEENSTSKLNLTCSECGKFFLFQNHLERHKASHDLNKLKTYKPRTKLKSEDVTVKQFLCSYCGKRFAQSAGLNVHLKIHTGERFKCTQCDKSYSTKLSLRYHLMAHKGEKPYPCPYCGKRFRKPSYYRHLLIHRGNRKFKCKICNKGFIRTDQLKQHLAFHKP